MEITQRHVVGSGTKTVAASGTAEALTAINLAAYSVTIVPLATNGGNIYVGDSAVDKTTNPTIPLAVSASVEFTAQVGRHIDLRDIYIDADVDGDGATFMYLAR